MDDSVIFCYQKRKKGMKLREIATILKMDHSSVIYKIKKYDDFKRFDSGFRKSIENYCECHFLTEYQKFISQQVKRSIIKKNRNILITNGL